MGCWILDSLSQSEWSSCPSTTGSIRDTTLLHWAALQNKLTEIHIVFQLSSKSLTHHQKLFWRLICSIRWEKQVAFSTWCPCTSIVLSPLRFHVYKLVFKCINPIPVGDVRFYQILENPLLWGLDEPIQLHTHKHLGKSQKDLGRCGVDVYLCPRCIGAI